MNFLLKILGLLANLLQFRLAGDHALRDCGVVCFRAEGVELAENFLSDEFQRATDWFVFCADDERIGRDDFPDAISSSDTSARSAKRRTSFNKRSSSMRNLETSLLNSIEERRHDIF